MTNSPYKELRAMSDYDLRKAIKSGNMTLGDFFRKRIPLEVATLQSITHSGDQLAVLGQLFEACRKNFERETRGGFASEAIIGYEPFARTLSGVEYACYDKEIAQLESDYRRRKFWYKLLTLGLGKNVPGEPRWPDHPLLIALDGLIYTGLVESIENPDTPRRSRVIFPSRTLVKQLLDVGRQATG